MAKVGRPKKYQEGIKLTTITRSVPVELIADIDKAIRELKETLVKSRKLN